MSIKPQTRSSVARKRFLRKTIATISVALAGTLTLSGCFTGSPTDNGMRSVQTQSEEFPLEDQYELMRATYEQMDKDFTAAQLAISADPWVWIDYGIVPYQGSRSPTLMPNEGAPPENSYFLQMSASVSFPEGKVSSADLEPILKYFDSLGLEATVDERGDSDPWFVAEAFTPAGSLFMYRVQSNGYCNLTLYSPVLLGEYSEILLSLNDRQPQDWVGPESSLPGDNVVFPRWSDPVLEPNRNDRE